MGKVIARLLISAGSSELFLYVYMLSTKNLYPVTLFLLKKNYVYIHLYI